MAGNSPIRVLVVDDSAFVRKVVTRMLARSASIEVVGTAHDGEDALERVATLQPDVVTLDLVMPGMNGVEFLRRQMARAPLPVVLCSIAHESGEMAMEAFDLGAVEFVQKPTALATDRVYEIADELVAKVIAAAKVDMARHPRAAAPALETVSSQAPLDANGVRAKALAEKTARRASRDADTPSRAMRAVGGANADVVVLGISTGGPQALREMIPRFGADFPVPIVMVLHMPVGYTEMYARRLDAISTLDVSEARDGQLLRPGVAVLAPAGQHLRIERDGDSVRLRLDVRPLDTQHRPSVDVLFRSAADVYGDRTLAVVMTGMGSDGLLGAAHIKAKGGRIITESESSCVVYGMPRAVVEAALSDRSAPLEQLASVIKEMV